MTAPPDDSTGDDGVSVWRHCTPALLDSGVDCAATPRRAGLEGVGHDHLVAATDTPAEWREDFALVRTYEGFAVEVHREQLSIYYPDGRFGFMVRLSDDEKRQLAEALHPARAALAATQEGT